MSERDDRRDETSDDELTEHLQGLGLGSVAEYRAWCGRHGFGRRTRKHPRLRQRELAFAKRQSADRRLAARQRERRSEARLLPQRVEDVCLNRRTVPTGTHPGFERLRHAVSAFTSGEQRQAAARLLTHVVRRGVDLFDDAPLIPRLGFTGGNALLEALVLVASRHHDWVRDAGAWRPRSRNRTRRFRSILQHLFVRYETPPRFLEAVWIPGANVPHAARDWYLHLGRGENLRHCNLPITYTNRMAVEFRRAPNDLSVWEAVRWGQVRGLGGDERLARAVIETYLGDYFENEEFWRTVLEWFVRHPEVTPDDVEEIVDFVDEQRFEEGEDGRPPWPDLTLRGRTPASVRRLIEEHQRREAERWERERLEREDRLRAWRASGIPAIRVGREHGRRSWLFRELLGGRELFTEGAKQRHCVATYAEKCADGHSSIWSLQVENWSVATKAVTIEVENASRTIVQASGKHNRDPTDEEWNVIRRWARAANLRLPTCLS